MRCCEHLPTEANTEYRYLMIMCVTQHLELGWHPGPYRFMIVNRPWRAHRHDRVKIRGVWKLDLDIGGEETVLPDDLMQDEVEPAVDQSLSHKARSTDVIMLNQQGAHLAESSLAPNEWPGRAVGLVGHLGAEARLPSVSAGKCSSTASRLSATPVGRYRSYPNKCRTRSAGRDEDMTITQTIVREHEADLVVRDAQKVADGVIAIILGAPDGAELPAWTPGAHIDFVLDDDLIRQYSLCSSPSTPDVWRVAVLRAPDSRGGSERVHDILAPGSIVRVRGPRNHFPLVMSPRYLFIAGGIGITPVLPMIAEADAAGADWRLVYGGRERASMAFLEQLTQYGDRVMVVPQDEQGMLDLESVLGTPQPDTLVYCCGPEGLLAAVEKFCEKWPPGSLHLERFSAKPQEPSAAADSEFELVLQRSGLTLEVPPDKSVLTVIREAGVSVLASCLEGVCGTCETEVIEGDVDHRDSVLNDEEQASNEYMMVCVSRCRSPQLVLDL
jgi:ferredoxin-NADP reductase